MAKDNNRKYEAIVFLSYQDKCILNKGVCIQAETVYYFQARLVVDGKQVTLQKSSRKRGAPVEISPEHEISYLGKDASGGQFRIRGASEFPTAIFPQKER